MANIATLDTQSESETDEDSSSTARQQKPPSLSKGKPPKIQKNGCTKDNLYRAELENLVEELENTQAKLIDQKKEIIKLKSEKSELLLQVHQFCVALEKKEDELDRFIQCYKKKAIETAQYIKQVASLADDLENARTRLTDLEQAMGPLHTPDSRRRPLSTIFTQTTSPSSHADLPDSAESYEMPVWRTPPTSVQVSPNADLFSTSQGSRGNLSSANHSYVTTATSESRDSLPKKRATDDAIPLKHKIMMKPPPTNSRLPTTPDSTLKPAPSSRGPQIHTEANATRPTNSSLSDFTDSEERSSSNLSRTIYPANGIHEEPSAATTGQGQSLRNGVTRMPTNVWTAGHVTTWLSDFVGLPDEVVRKVAELGITGEKLVKFTEKNMQKQLAISDPLLRRKFSLAIEDLTVFGPPGYLLGLPSSTRLTATWVANHWLPIDIGLPHLSSAFLAKWVDIRVLTSLARLDRKECAKLIGCKLSKHELTSLKTGVDLLRRVGYNLQTLGKRRELAENTNIDPVVWTNGRLEKWLRKSNLTKYTGGFSASGLHGAYVVLDNNFTATALAKILNIPSAEIRNVQLDEKFLTLVKPARMNEHVPVKRSTSLFSSTRRRSSQTNTPTFRASPGGAMATSVHTLSPTEQRPNSQYDAVALHHKGDNTAASTEFIRGYRLGSTGSNEGDSFTQNTTGSGNRIRMSFRSTPKKSGKSKDRNPMTRSMTDNPKNDRQRDNDEETPLMGTKSPEPTLTPRSAVGRISSAARRAVNSSFVDSTAAQKPGGPTGDAKISSKSVPNLANDAEPPTSIDSQQDHRVPSPRQPPDTTENAPGKQDTTRHQTSPRKTARSSTLSTPIKAVEAQASRINNDSFTSTESARNARTIDSKQTHPSPLKSSTTVTPTHERASRSQTRPFRMTKSPVFNEKNCGTLI